MVYYLSLDNSLNSTFYLKEDLESGDSAQLLLQCQQVISFPQRQKCSTFHKAQNKNYQYQNLQRFHCLVYSHDQCLLFQQKVILIWGISKYSFGNTQNQSKETNIHKRTHSHPLYLIKSHISDMYFLTFKSENCC